MARLTKILSVKTVAALSKPGRHLDGEGLYLDIAPGGRPVDAHLLCLWRLSPGRSNPHSLRLGTFSLAI